ncbi:MAG: hypothetical protein F8N37_14860 [Telmatospirillum sp.]|nr:hypothetical protein [Telmatospirillum sp.]
MMRVLLAGATGLVGNLVSARLAGRADVDLIRLVRVAAGPADRAVDFEALAARPGEVMAAIAPDGADVAISCLGTTLRKAGSREAFWRVDHDYVAAFAAGARAVGARQAILVSSAGAGGGGFYLKTKGATERALTGLGFVRVDVVRPGLLLGRRSETRLGERAGQILLPALRPLLAGPLAPYRAIPAARVAAAIAGLTGRTEPGVHIHDNEALEALGGG